MNNKYSTCTKHSGPIAIICAGLLMVITACRSNNLQATQGFDITTKPVAHMTAQTRAKQLAERDAQDALKKYILTYIEQYPDISYTDLTQKINQDLTGYYTIGIAEKEFIKGKPMNRVGYPISFSKTHLQINMAKEWAKIQQEDLIGAIKSGRLYHNLYNAIAPDALPVLQSPSDSVFWGNENPSVSSALLASIAASFSRQEKNMAGAATFYGFLDPSFEFPDGVVTEAYPFATKKGMQLMGAYQYGGHRYFEKQLVFGPEDCSSSVGKATYLTTEQIKSLTTNSMIAAYSNPNNPYHYQPVTELAGSIRDEQLKLIQAGDIYLVKGHTAIVATKPDNYCKVTTLQFNRDIDSLTNKQLGGGVYDYNLSEEAKKHPIYILRSNVEPFHESTTLDQFLDKVDSNYLRFFPNGPTDAAGDCRLFFENG